MMIIIVGENRVEFCKIRRKDLDKRLFEHRGQAYPVFPQNLVRMRYLDPEGRQIKEPEEVMIFPEGSSVAYDTLPDAIDVYYQENMFPMLDIIRDTPIPLRQSRFMKAVSSGWKAMLPHFGVILTILILAWAVLG